MQMSTMRKRTSKRLAGLVLAAVLTLMAAVPALADVVTIRPDGVIASGTWTGVSAANLNDSSDATLATTTTAPNTFTVSLADNAAYAGAAINSVTIWVRASATGSNTAERLDFGPAGALSGAPKNITRGSFNGYNYTPAGPFTSGDVDSLAIDVAASTLGGSESLDVADVWVVVDYTPVAANNQINSCDGCHAQPPVEDLARSGANGAVVGSHGAHTAYVCTTCHPNNAVLNHRGAGSGSTAGQIEMLANIQGGTYSEGTAFPQDNDINGTGLGTCSNVTCHGGAATTTPQWGGAAGLNCDGCHGAPPSTNAHPEHYAAKGWGATDLAGTYCVLCHPDNTGTHSDVTDGNVIVSAGLSPGGVSPAISCGSAPVLGCHNGKATPNWNTVTSITCTDCHTPGGANIADPQSGLHNMTETGVQKHDNTLDDGNGGNGVGCTECHLTKPSSHADGIFNPNSNNNTDRFITRANLTWTDAAVNSASCSGTGLTGCHSDSGAWSRLWSTAANSTVTTVGDARCDVCHGQFSDWRAGTSHGETFGGTASTRGNSHNSLGGATNACEDCHSYPSLSNHENNQITMNDGGATVVVEVGGLAFCDLCHDNDGSYATDGTHTFKQSVFTLQTVSGANDPIGSCTGCHGGGTVGASESNYWPDGSNTNAENLPAQNKHLVHITRLASKRYGETIAQLLTDNGNGLSDVKQKSLCDYCHKATTQDATHRNGTANVFPAGNSKTLWNTVDADAAYLAGSDTCNTVDCHNSKTTEDNTYGWYDAGTSTCTMCHTVGGAGANPNTGLHNTTAGLMVSGKPHDDTLKPASGCQACHGMPVINNTGGATHINGTFTADSAANTDRGLTGLYTDAAANSGTCSGGIAGAAGCHDGVGDAGGWTRRWSNTADDGGTAPCANCHGGVAGSPWNFGNDNAVGDGSVSHLRNWDGDGSAEVMANHDSANQCNTCHVYPDSPYSITWGAGYHGNDQIDMNSSMGYTEGTWNCTSTCHDDNTNHNLEDSGWNVNPVAGPALACTDCHGATSPKAGVGTGSPHVQVSRTPGTVACENCHPGGTKGATHSNAGQASVVVILNNTALGINYSHDVDTAGGVQNGFVLGGNATSGTTEAEICWNCHVGLSPMASEWGTNTGGTYNYGSLHSSLADGTASPGNHLNWTTGFWKSGAGFTYKNGALGVRPTHADGSVGSNTRYTGNRASASLHATGGTVGTQSNTLAQVRCSYCHDVHDTRAGSPNGKPYLRGTWKSNPYKEDGAPRAGVSFAVVNNHFGNVPRGGPQNTGNGAWQIDQNNASPNSTYVYATNDGLCNLCHTQASLQTAWAGHSNSVRGFTNDTTAARNIFDFTKRGLPGGTQDNRTTRAHMAYQNVTQFFNSDYMGGLRSNDVAADVSSLAAPRVGGINDRYPYLNFQWGTQGTGLTQIAVSVSAVNADYHSFSCSKCHNPHASRLPRLMVTNCLDTKLNTWDDQYQGDANWAAGGWNLDTTGNKQLAYATTAQNCHRRIDANGDGDTADAGEEAGWNTATPW